MPTHKDYLGTTDTTEGLSAMVTARERVRRRGEVVEQQAQLDGAQPVSECLVNLGHERDAAVGQRAQHVQLPQRSVALQWGGQ